jgi:hypothetical protein
MTRLVPAVIIVVASALSFSCSSSNKSSGDALNFRGADGNRTVLPDGDIVLNDSGGAPGITCQLSQDCPFDLPICDQFSNTCVECKQNDDCSDEEKPFCNPASMTCVECVMKNHCTSEYEFCLEGTCSDKPCFPGHANCIGNTVHICSPDGMDPNFETIPCGEKTCHKGLCLECKPNETNCKGNLVIKCHSDGKAYDVLETCEGNLQCLAGSCMFCYPGDKMCEGNAAMRCNVAGTAWEMVQDCATEGLSCYMGTCLSPCAGDLKQNTNAGCEFYAVDLDNAEEGTYDAQHAQFAVIASNTSKTEPAQVTVTLPDGSQKEASIPPMSLQKFELPATWSLDGTEKSNKAFRINSSRPITVYQFNPLSNIIEVFSNDASVLLPAPSLGTEYYIMSFKQYESTFRGYLTVIGTSNVPTEVTVTPACSTLAGGDIPALDKGQAHTLTLNQGEVLHIESNQPGGDLTGSHVKASAPVAVFGGHEATNTATECCADHLEQQMMPVSTWGTHYLVTKTWERWLEKDHVRILAAHDGTTVTLNPNIVTVPTLNKGTYYTFQISANVEITTSKPVTVAQYLASSYEILGGGCPPPFTEDWMYGCIGPSCTNANQCPSGTTCEIDMGTGYCAPIGDPAMMMAVAQEQFMESYVFLVPDAYIADYLNVIAPLNAQNVVLDNNQINPASFSPIGSSGYGVYRTVMSDGIHSIWSDAKIGIVVYGYDDDVSYGYPGGMGLMDLDI